MTKISVSILPADFSNLEKEIKELEKAGADMIHFDVMDGQFVDNITFGDYLIKSLRNKSNLPFDTHLMIENPEKQVKKFLDAGSDMITIHIEAIDDNFFKIKKIVEYYKKKFGIAINPETQVNKIEPYINYVNHVLVMTVKPGAFGRDFINQTEKIEYLKRFKNIEIGVDGGINDTNSKILIDAGAHYLVSASFIFRNNYADAIKRLKGL
ncbi:MAG: ribulose-phosphate 3-epimerase [Candidatus Aenigmatarchaeota archaeon]